MADNSKEDKKGKARGKSLDFPVIPLLSAIEIAEAIEKKCGGKAKSYATISEAAEVKGGALIGKIAAARRYGLIEGKGEIRVTMLAKRILHPPKEGEDKKAMAEAVLHVPLFKEIEERFDSNLPPKSTFSNILHLEYEVPLNLKNRVANAVIKNREIMESAGAEKKVDSENNEIEETQVDTKSAFPLKIVTKVGKFEFDINDTTDWEAVDAVVKMLKNKWENKQE